MSPFSRGGSSTFTVPATCLAFLPAIFGACSPGYVLRAGWEEAKILRDRRPIADVVHDTTTSSEMRQKLRLVQNARAFAVRELGLEAGDSFMSYARVESDTLLLVVSAAPELQLAWKTWWFPIVGRVPYRGYFHFDRARRDAEVGLAGDAAVGGVADVVGEQAVVEGRLEFLRKARVLDGV